MATSTFIPVNDLHPASWHQERALGIGGSEAASLFNAGYGCLKRLVMEKRGMEPDYKRTRQQELTLRRGNKLEDIVANEFVDETGLKVRRQSAKVSRTSPHARVNLDRQIIAVDPTHLRAITLNDEGKSVLDPILLDPGPGALECKTMNTIDFRKLQKDGLVKHDHYILQLQHAMAVTGYKWGVFAILDTTSFDLLWFPMLRNDRLCTELLERTEMTWDLVQDTTQPLPAPLETGDKRCNHCLHRRTCRGEAYLEQHVGADFSSDYVETNDPELVELANDLIAAEEQQDQASAVVTAIKERVKECMKAAGATKLKVPDVIRFCVSSSAGRRGWDGPALDGEINSLNKGELHEDVLQQIHAKVAPEQFDVADQVISLLLPAVAGRFANCKKFGKPSTSFRTYSA
jgi:predicted phage-related endonuclease